MDPKKILDRMKNDKHRGRTEDVGEAWEMRLGEGRRVITEPKERGDKEKAPEGTEKGKAKGIGTWDDGKRWMEG
jgi:hypothetical protein